MPDEPTATDSRRSAAATRRRQREKQILQATRELFDERGVRDVNIDDIARLVGTNRAILYRHFSGKEELFALTLVGYLDELRERLDKVAAAHAGPQERLEALVEEFVDFGLEYPAFVDCAQALMRRPGPELLDEISESALFRLGRSISACLGALQLARVGMLIKELAPGVPGIAPVSPEQVKRYLVATSRALATTAP